MNVAKAPSHVTVPATGVSSQKRSLMVVSLMEAGLMRSLNVIRTVVSSSRPKVQSSGLIDSTRGEVVSEEVIGMLTQCESSPGRLHAERRTVMSRTG